MTIATSSKLATGWKLLTAATLLIVAPVIGCQRDGHTAAADSTVDHAYTLPSDMTGSFPNESPNESPNEGVKPLAIGGGPASDQSYVYSQQSALDVLTSARCHRAATCGIKAANCRGEAAAAHGSDLLRCDQGVRGAELADCARQVRSAPCGSSLPLPETCNTAALCVAP